MKRQRWDISKKLVEEAQKSEEIQVVEGQLENGQRIMVLVAVGANAGLVHQHLIDSGLLVETGKN